MKVEIGESLMLSYLKHIKKCVFYQVNWKVSSNWNVSNSKIVQNIYERISENLIFDVFKKSNLNQLIKQSEIDVIGMDSNETIYAIDIAYHEAGLNYGSKEETKNRVLKKLLRSYLTLLTYFPGKNYELVFVSPKVHNTTEIMIRAYFTELDKDFSTENVKFKYISNDQFRDEIVIPTIKNTKDDSDTNELFLRSIKLMNLFDLYSEPSKLDANINNESISENNEIQRYDSFVAKNNLFNKRGMVPEKEYFINNLMVDKHAFERKLRNNICEVRVTLYYNDKNSKKSIWTVRNFTETSSLTGNLSSGLLRDWSKKGIIKIRLEL